VYGSVNGSASSPSTDPPGLREDVVYLLQQLQMLKKFNFEQDGRFDLVHLIQELAREIRSCFSDSQREKALEYLFDLVHESQTRPVNSDIADWLKQLRAHGTEPHHPDDERPTSSIGDDTMSVKSAPGRMNRTDVPRAPTSDRGGGSSSAQPSRPAGGDRAAGAGRSDSTDGAVVVASTDRGDIPENPRDTLNWDFGTPASTPPRDRSRTRGEAAARSDSRASADSLDQFHEATYVPPAASTPARGGKDSSAQPTAPENDKSTPRWFVDPNASPPRQRPTDYYRSGGRDVGR
jgi:hypothetical protein